MKDLYIVSKFTILDMIRRKSFIISFIIILVLMLIGFNVPNIVKSIKGDDSLSKSYIVDKDNIFEGLLVNLNEMDLGYEFIIDNNDISFEEIKEKIDKGEIDEAIVVKKDSGKLLIDYVIENSALYDGVPSSLQNVFNTLYYELQVSKLNLTEEEYSNIHEKITYSLVQTDLEEVKGNPFGVMLVSLALFMIIYFFAFQVSSAITIEKTSKIIETLVTSTNPKNIVLGKTIGIGIVGLIEFAIFIVFGVVCKNLFFDESFLEGIIDFSTFTPFLAFITLVYFILGYGVYALLYALVGSTVSKPEDVQTANGPIGLILVGGFYLSYFSMMNPTSSVNKIASIIPISSPFCMPFRIMMDIASPSEIILSLVVLVLTCILVAYVSIRIYSNAILNYGCKISFKETLKLFKNRD